MNFGSSDHALFKLHVHADEYYKAMDDEIHNITRRDTQDIVPRNHVTGIKI